MNGIAPKTAKISPDHAVFRSLYFPKNAVSLCQAWGELFDFMREGLNATLESHLRACIQSVVLAKNGGRTITFPSLRMRVPNDCVRNATGDFADW